MSDKSYITAVPAYRVCLDGLAVPLIVGIYLEDNTGKQVLVPSLTNSIDLTVQITNIEGLAHARIKRFSDIGALVPSYLSGVARAGSAILLLLCDTAEIAEGVMQYINEHYDLSLVKRGGTWSHVSEATP